MTDQRPAKSGLAKWLDDLQRESWQLELLISGFSIFLLLGGWDWVKGLEYDLVLLQQGSEVYFSLDPLYHTGRVAYATLTACLLLHVILRGVWIAAVGLRSVSGGINYDALRYQEHFKQKLQRRMGTFDEYIERLEKYCSVLFSVAFLILFSSMALATSLMLFVFVQDVIFSYYLNTSNGATAWISGIVGFLFLLICAVYFIDFLTLGIFKRNRWVSKPYYYLYRFMGWVTLARFYRPLYHNLIDDRFGRRLAIAIPFIILTVFLVTSLKPVNYAFMPGLLGDGEQWVYKEFYDDEANDSVARSWRPSLTSRFAQNNYVEVFVPYIPINDDSLLVLQDPSLQIARYTGVAFRGAISAGDYHNYEANYPALLAAFSRIHQLWINDSLITSVHPRFYQHTTRKQPGVLYSIPVHELPAGEHKLRLDRRQYRRDTVAYSKGSTIYIYK